MVILCKCTVTESILYNRNETEWKTEIDITLLNEEEKTYLARRFRNSTSMAVIYGKDFLLNETGDVTPETIKRAMQEEKNENQKRFQTAMADAQRDYEKYLKNPHAYLTYSFPHDKDLTPEQKSQKQEVLKKFETQKKLYEKEEKEEEKEREKILKQESVAFEERMFPIVELYENGGERPVWEKKWLGSDELLKRICREDTRRAKEKEEEEENRKKLQLTEAVKKYGSQIQKEKWEAHLMSRREVLDLIWINWVKPLESNEFDPLNEGLHLTTDECEKKTLTDDQWQKAKKIQKLMPLALISYYHQYDKDSPDCAYDIARLTQKIGEYYFVADIIL